MPKVCSAGICTGGRFANRHLPLASSIMSTHTDACDVVHKHTHTPHTLTQLLSLTHTKALMADRRSQRSGAMAEPRWKNDGRKKQEHDVRAEWPCA